MSSFLDRLFGRRDRVVRASPQDDDDREPAEPKAERRYLEFVGGNSAKFYAAVLHGSDDDGWTVAFNYGRIGHPRDWGFKVEGTDEDDARDVFEDLIAEKMRGGYRAQAWPSSLSMPDGAGEWGDDADVADDSGARTSGTGRYQAASPGTLPPPEGGLVADVKLPPGVLVAPEESEDRAPVIWISRQPVERVDEVWRSLARAFSDTGLWPLILELEIDPEGMAEIFLGGPEGGGGGARNVLARWWAESVGEDEDFDEDAFAPFGPRFPGLAAATPPGGSPVDLDPLLTGLTGHLGLVAVERPGDVIRTTQWSGAANYDADPADQSTILRSWEDRFEAYIVGLGWDTVIVAVGRPPGDRKAAAGIAAEHMAFCPDIITQGVGTVREYADTLVKAPLWHFWWD